MSGKCPIVLLHVQEIHVFALFSVSELYRHDPLLIDVDADENVIDVFEFLNLTPCHWKFDARKI